MAYKRFWAQIRSLLDAAQRGPARRLILELAGAPPAGFVVLCLRLEHNCASPACSLQHCQLCLGAPLRRCDTHVAASCAHGESPRAPCGESLTLRVYRSGDTQPLSACALGEAFPEAKLQVRLVRGSSVSGQADEAAAPQQEVQEWPAPDTSNCPTLRVSGGVCRSSALFTPRNAGGLSNALQCPVPPVLLEGAGEGTGSELWRVEARLVLPVHLDEASPPHGDLVELGSVRSALSAPFAVQRSAAHVATEKRCTEVRCRPCHGMLSAAHAAASRRPAYTPAVTATGGRGMQPCKVAAYTGTARTSQG